MNEALREVHGVHLKEGIESKPQVVREADDKIIIVGVIDIKLSPASARHLASVLYRLAARIEKRIAANTPINDTSHAPD